MTISRRGLIRTLVALCAAPVAFCQQVFRGWPWATLRFQTTHAAGFSPSFTKTGALLHWAWGDGTYTDSNAPVKNYGAGTKTFWVSSRDGFRGVTNFNSPSLDFVDGLPSFAICTALKDFRGHSNNFSGALPSFAACIPLDYFRCDSNSFNGVLPSFAACVNLWTFYCQTNSFSGTLPSFAACTALAYFSCYANSFSGALPSFAACTALREISCSGNSFSGTLPSFAACTALTYFSCLNNSFSDVVPGSFATQKSMATASFSANALPQTAVDQVLADCVVSLAIPGRVICTVTLTGGTNAHPSAAGIADGVLLIAAGWTVSYN